MQHVLGTYPSLQTAEAAVRTLESRGFSIQNMVIADHHHRVWRKLHASSGADTRSSLTGFVVYTLDDTEISERARAVLSVPVTGVDA